MDGAMTGRRLFCFGIGYTIRALAPRLQAAGAAISGTVRAPEAATSLAEFGIRAHGFDGTSPLPDDAFDGVTDILVSIPPDAAGCPALRALVGRIPDGLRWTCYLSSSAVYGNADGGWVDEATPLAPLGKDGHNRTIAEAQWAHAATKAGVPLDRMRLSGIYGPNGRSPFDRLRMGGERATAIHKPGQVFNRIHVEDAASAILAAMSTPDDSRILNIADDLPAGADEVLLYAAEIGGFPEPRVIPYDPANLPRGFAGFYAENRRLRNTALKSLPGFRLRHPDYRSGLQATLTAEASTAI